jgi:hypothetical protein
MLQPPGYGRSRAFPEVEPLFKELDATTYDRVAYTIRETPFLYKRLAGRIPQVDTFEEVAAIRRAELGFNRVDERRYGSVSRFLGFLLLALPTPQGETEHQGRSREGAAESLLPPETGSEPGRYFMSSFRAYSEVFREDGKHRL